MASEIFIGTTPAEGERLLDWCVDQLKDGKPKKFTCVNTQKRSKSQNSLQHQWYTEISKQLVKSGRDWCTDAWVKRNLKKTFLGMVEVQDVNMQTGEVSSAWEVRSSAKLDKGDAQYYMEQIESWCASAGLEITIPNKSEFFENQQEQNK